MGRKSKGGKTGGGSEKPPKSKALANLMSYQFDDSGSMDEDSQSDTPPPPPPPPSLNKPHSDVDEPLSQSSPSTNKKPLVKFAVKRQFDRMKAFGIKPKAKSDVVKSDIIKVHSKWDDDDEDSISASDVSESPAPIGPPQLGALQSVGLYETGSSREGTPLLDEPMTSQITSKLIKKHDESMVAKTEEVFVCSENLFQTKKSHVTLPSHNNIQKKM